MYDCILSRIGYETSGLNLNIYINDFRTILQTEPQTN